ncbi:unnamed protein product [Ectocarpus sp. 12 AP-2014]
MTRWDCDVKLWKGVPCSFPAFHGWPSSSSVHHDNRDIVSSSTASTRYSWCHACYNWIPDNTRHHDCSAPGGITDRTAPASENCEESDSLDIPKDWVDSGEDESTPKPRAYVLVPDEDSDFLRCSLCNDRMRLDFLHDIEQWVFMDCVEHDGTILHEICRDVVYN